MKVAPTLATNIDTLNALLLGIPDKPQFARDSNSAQVNNVKRHGTTTAWREMLVEALVKNQYEPSGWKPCSQLPTQKGSLEETTHVTTA